MAQTLKEIHAGNLTKIVLYPRQLPRDPERVRAAKRAASTAARRRLNHRGAISNLELLLACNFTGRDFFVSLTYDSEHIPENLAQAKKDVKSFLARVRSTRRMAGRPLKYIYVLEGLHGEHRLHAHLVINDAGDDVEELVVSLWRAGVVTDCKPIRKSFTDEITGCLSFEKLALYLGKEPNTERPNGMRLFVPSRGLVRPMIRTDILPDGLTIAPPPGSIVLQDERNETPFASFSYLKYVDPAEDGSAPELARS